MTTLRFLKGGIPRPPAAWDFSLTTAALFHHKPSSKIIDYQPAARDNRDSDWGSFEGRASTKTTLETAPKPFQRSLTT